MGRQTEFPSAVPEKLSRTWPAEKPSAACAIMASFARVRCSTCRAARELSVEAKGRTRARLRKALPESVARVCMLSSPRMGSSSSTILSIVRLVLLWMTSEFCSTDRRISLASVSTTAFRVSASTQTERVLVADYLGDGTRSRLAVEARQTQSAIHAGIQPHEGESGQGTLMAGARDRVQRGVQGFLLDCDHV